MVQYDKIVLNKLLDTYESSLLSTGENNRTIHIEFRFSKKSIPAYFDESSDEYEKIHILMQQLEEKNFIQILWKQNKIGHIISKVRLNTEELESVYAYLHRTPKKDMVSANLQLFQSYMKNQLTPVCKAFIEYLLERLKAHKSVKEFIDLQNLEQTKWLLNAIQKIEKNDGQLYVREFSILNFQDSKIFEQMGSKLAHVFKHFKEGCVDQDFSEILAEYGIYDTPNYVYLKGDAVISIGDERIDLSLLHQGIGISGEDIGKIRFSDTSRIQKVITIENLTTFFRWYEPDCLLIYLGGYHNSVRRLLLKKIYSNNPDAKYYHFGDIDAGGFDIYRDLCRKTEIPFAMYKMDLETLKSYEKYGKRLTENDRKRLQEMKTQEELQEVISYMLEHDVKLEQECVGMTAVFPL